LEDRKEMLENTNGAKWTIQRNWQPRVDKTRTKKTKNNTICAGHHNAQRNTNNVNRT
jgi:hypothetical protein